MRIYMDSSKSIEERVNDLISRMTLKEKIGQLNQYIHGWNGFKVEDGDVIITDTFKNEIDFGDGVGAIYGIFRADGWNSNVTMGINVKDSIKVVNTLQKYVIENTRLGIPMLITEECPHGHEALESTTFPTNIGIGSTWNPDLYERECDVIAKELRARGGHLALISTLDVTTDPRWGRSEECYSEDPHLIGCFSEKAVEGIQGKDNTKMNNSLKAIAVLKHFCGQGATIGGHNGRSTNIGERELREIHLEGMRKGAKAGALGCMAAYNDLDGVPCHINRNLLTDILRKEMGFKGFVMSDGKGADRLNSITGSSEKSGAGAVHAGVDMNLWNDCYLVLENAVEKGYISEEDINTAAERILRIKFMLGLFENPYVDEETAIKLIGNEESKKVALEVSREVPVLLENKNNILPITNKLSKIAVIGPNSDKKYNQLGDYTQWKEDKEVVTVLEGIKKNCSLETEVVYAEGCPIASKDKSGFDEAISISRDADVIILVLGGSSTREPGMDFEDNGAVFMNKFTAELNCGEAVDLADIRLGGVQVELAQELKKLGKPIVTILIQGRAHAVPEIKEISDALLCSWYPGEQGGQAIGEIIFGKTSPSGRLSVSIPVSSSQLPVYYNQKDIKPYVDISEKPLYSFGYGLSYTTFEYNDFNIEKEELTADDIIAGKRFVINFKIKNTGDYDSKEVAQLYIHDMESCITRRTKELKDFKKVYIKKGCTEEISLSVGLDELSIFNYDMDFVLEPGNVKIMIGNSSDNIIYEKVVTIK